MVIRAMWLDRFSITEQPLMFRVSQSTLQCSVGSPCLRNHITYSVPQMTLHASI